MKINIYPSDLTDTYAKKGALHLSFQTGAISPQFAQYRTTTNYNMSVVPQAVKFL